jgi:hypothetical protein
MFLPALAQKCLAKSQQHGTGWAQPHGELTTMKKLLIATAMTALAAQANAVTVRDCDGTTDSARNIVEPWDQNSRQFHNKLVRVTRLDTGGEPVCCSTHLMVTYPSAGQDEPVYAECKLVGTKEGAGFLSIDFAKLKAKYDPKTGLTFTFPYTTYNDSGDNHPAGMAKLRLDLKKGELKAVK